MASAVIVIPVYKTSLSEDERASLSRCFSVLKRYPIVYMAPEGLDLEPLTQSFPPMRVERFAASYFASKVSYNALMLSPEFYERFSAWEYLLLYQLDAWVFRDDLSMWLDRGYDYVGAPWPIRPIYRHPLYKFCSALKTRMMSADKTADDRHACRGRVGNGGFSLRRTRTIAELLRRHADRVDYYVQRSSFPRYYEDVFFAVEAPRLEADFKTPTLEEALAFAFDTYPALCYRLNGHQLPFGCHGFNKRKSRAFWKKQGLPSLRS